MSLRAESSELFQLGQFLIAAFACGRNFEFHKRERRFKLPATSKLIQSERGEFEQIVG